MCYVGVVELKKKIKIKCYYYSIIGHSLVGNMTDRTMFVHTRRARLLFA